jgi:hypothetical protein
MRLVDGRAHRALIIREINGKSAHQSTLVEDLLRCGFVSTHEGLYYRPAAG